MIAVSLFGAALSIFILGNAIRTNSLAFAILGAACLAWNGYYLVAAAS